MAETFWKGLVPVEKGLGEVRSRLWGHLESFPSEIKNELRPYFQRPGKSLRAGLVILASGQEPASKAVLDCAAAIEILHLASLIHDDVVDGARLRRGEPALHENLGIPKAVLYGDFLFAACFRLISQEVSPQTAQNLAAVVGLMTGSEILQLKDRWVVPQSQRRLLRKSMGKTAALFALSLYAGAKEGGREAADCEKLRRAGYSLGMAFQLQDDLLDWTGRENDLGKPVLEDLRTGNYTLPVHFAWKKHPEKVEKSLEKWKLGIGDPEAMAKTWESQGFFAKTQKVIDHYWKRSLLDLSNVGSALELASWIEVVKRIENRIK